MTHTLTAGDDTPHTPQIRVQAASPRDLLSIVPLVLGFRPASSLVVLGTEPPRGRVKLTLRYDLPDPPGAGASANLAGHAVGVLSSQLIETAVAVAYGPEILVDQVAAALRDTADQAGIELLDFLRVEEGRYWSYCCGNEECCPSAGVPFEQAPPPGATPAATAGPATASTAGTVSASTAGIEVLPDRAAVVARVAPVAGLAAESMRQATRRAELHVSQLLAKVRRSSRLGAARHMIAAEGLAAVGEMIGVYRAGGGYVTEYEIARMTVALRDLRVRDDAWARMDPAHRDAHGRLWTDVTRMAQPTYVAAPAALLAFVAWQSGDGALANVALDRSLADDPGYSMALLLRQVITAGAPPSMARLPMTPEEVAASYDDTDADDYATEDCPTDDTDAGDYPTDDYPADDEAADDEAADDEAADDEAADDEPDLTVQDADPDEDEGDEL